MIISDLCGDAVPEDTTEDIQAPLKRNTAPGPDGIPYEDQGNLSDDDTEELAK